MTALVETTKLNPVALPIRTTFAEVLASSSGSVAGFHANSEWLTCPERSRLKALGLKRKPPLDFEKDKELNALDYGILLHELLALRVCYGHDVALNTLNVWSPELGASWQKATAMLSVYEETFPYAADPLQFLGVEVPVITNIRATETSPLPCLRSVRYDGLVYAVSAGGTKQLYSLERKSMSRSGPGALSAYKAQAMIQVALWNANKALVEQYGKMHGVIFETLVKTKIPSVDRIPEYVSPKQEQLARDYMRYSTNGIVQFSQLPDGTYPKFLHACWGRWAPCDFISLCHDEIVGDYTLNGEDIS